MHSPQGPEEPEDNFLTLEEAIAYLGLTAPQLASLVKQYGIGRYIMPRAENTFVYAYEDIEGLRASLAAQANQGPAT